MLNSLKYLFALTTPMIAFVALSLEGWGAYLLLLYGFILIPILELIIPISAQNLNEIEEQMAKKNLIYDFILYSIVPIQFGLLYYFLERIEHSNSLYNTIGYIITMGLSCGVFGINVAHELGHRNSKIEQFLAKILLLSSLYMHFFIEHNKGHHKNVSTDADPASSLKNETVYQFWIRSSIKGWIDAWNIETKRLLKKNVRILSFQNEMLNYQMIQLFFAAVIFYMFGLIGFLGFIASSTIGILLLETVNYIEHYGLRRNKNEYDEYEKTLPIHSWNSNHPLGRLLLFELTRHSDHHYSSSRKYQVLRSLDQSPQLPSGYPGMMILSLVPKLWFDVMNPRVDEVMKPYQKSNK